MRRLTSLLPFHASSAATLSGHSFWLRCSHAKCALARCMLQFRFKPLAEDSMGDRINFICAQEGLTLQPGVMGTLGTAAGGDMRKAITILQSSSRLYGTTSPPHRSCVCWFRTSKHRFSHPPCDEALATAQPGESSHSCPVGG